MLLLQQAPSRVRTPLSYGFLLQGQVGAWAALGAVSNVGGPWSLPSLHRSMVVQPRGSLRKPGHSQETVPSVPSKGQARSSRAAVPKLFGTRHQFCQRQCFHGLGWGDGFGMIQVLYIYCALHFYYYYISSTSDHQALDPGGWGPRPYWILPKRSFGGSPFVEWELSPERTCTPGQPMPTESLA